MEKANVLTSDPAWPHINNRYRIEARIGIGGMGVVYRAIDRLTGQTVALKSVTVPAKQLVFSSSNIHSTGDSANFRLALAQEFEILASLFHPNIISVLDYGFDTARQPYFTMELLENAQTLTEYGKPKTVQEKIILLIQVVQALAYLHRRGIIHRDLKPDNALVVGNQVKVLDFGLAIARERLQADEPAVGTIAYMAPEILFQTAPHSEASDLYSLGMIAYELFAGQHPFDVRASNRLMLDIANTIPDVTLLEIDPQLQLMIATLLSKQPENRYRDAGELLGVYEQWIGQQAQIETIPIRESYLQAARFVGRQQERAQLESALETVTATKQGQAWLIGGESGVGKSRFVAEMRTLALVNGTQVLHGQAITENSAPFWMWRDALRRLCLLTDLTEFEASVLKTLVPDIDVLLNRPVIDAPPLDPQSAQLRLLTVIEDVFLKQNRVTVLLLEDLQWANESLEILKRLVRVVSQVPLLIIATYRDDERPDLPAELPQMQPISLKPLDITAISDLSASIIGESGRDTSLVNMLQRETDGNILFIIDVIRVLAESAGQLSRIDTKNLPSVEVTRSGMLQRRLQKIPDYAQPLLRIAAVAGRELDLDVLHTVAPEINLNYWLAAVSVIIEVQDNHYRFAHDKLREGLIATLSPDEQQKIHHDLARTLETVHPDNHALLAFHWRQAHDIVKEVIYAKSAGLRALEVGTFREAISFLERALQLADQLQHAPSERAFLEYQLGIAYLSMGLTQESAAHFENGLALLGVPVPGTSASLRLQMLKAVAVQMSHRFKMEVLRQSVRIPDRVDEYELSARIATDVGIPYSISGKTSLALYVLFQSINWAENAGDRANDVAYVGHTFAGDIFGMSLPKLGAVFSRRAAALRASITSKKALGASFRNHALLVGASGDWQTSTAYYQQSVQLAQEIGDVRLLLTTHTLHLVLAFFFASDWGGLIPLAELIRDMAERQDDYQSRGVAIGWQIILLLARGEYEVVQAVKNRNQAFMESLDEPGAQRYIIAANMQLLWRQGRFSESLTEAERLLTMMPSVPAEPAYIIFLHLLHELFFTAWEQDPSPENQTRALHVLKMMGTYARLYPIGKPLTALYQCWRAGIIGDVKQIQQQGAKALKLARHYQMPWIESLAHYRLARCLKNDSVGRRDHLTDAKVIFEQLGEAWYSQDVEAMLLASD